MFDPKRYRNACDQLTLDAEKLEEMIAMTENTKKPMRRAWKAALIAAACVAALTVTAFAAPAVQQLFTTYIVTYRSGAGMETAIAIPPMNLAERDGRTILTVDEEEIDVTDAFATDGQYTFERDGAAITVSSDGWVDIATEDGMPMSYGFNLYGKVPSSGADDPRADAAPMEEAELPHPNADEVQEQFTVLPGPDGAMTIYDSHGNLVDTDLPGAADVPAQ